ncbi:Dipeptidyl aminopeptidase BI [Pseudidiomarina piscicola]|uniref:Dipeptidyl aminopeptidase BI n=1 Tax=Pseudidiomarina piscicola TaxID=2614830 RepID=A0A6S6WJG9_9GAMM|nr:S9 family peptidase [Pseudidiomarina piscicola]CAB0150794.1 Dipeptidyl aminopeptidase BI [Pseudidiomarina piscicola]VZT40298.1 Dipeptidyl aminopeptidase BI [Pseudomonas aeruginosa]
MLRSRLWTHSAASLATLFILTACQPQPTSSSQPSADEAPTAKREPYTIVSPHGERVDHYYWLRDDERQDPEVLAYLQAENSYYDSYRADYQALTDGLESELMSRVKQDDESVPYQRGDYLYQTHYETGKEYPIYSRTHLASGTEQVMLDVNELAAGQSFMQVSNLQVSPDQSKLAYMVDDVGRRQYELFVRDLASGETTATEMKGLSSAVAWAQDNQTLYVVENDPQTLLSTRVLKYQLGSAAASAELVYEEHDESFYMWVSNSNDNQFVMISLQSTVSNEIHVLDAANPDGEFQILAPRERHLQYSADHIDGRWIILTDYQAPNFQVMEVATEDLGDKAKWQTLVAHDENVYIHGISLFTDYLALNERHDGLRQVRIVPWSEPESGHVIKADEPTYVMTFETNVEQDTEVLRYNYTSLVTPTVTYAYNMATREREVLKATQVPNFDTTKYATERTWATADDGTKVPVSLLYSKDFTQDGTAPLYQYAYGSYGSTSEPWFRQSVFSLVDRGFVYAIAHIRGGQEMGRHWYEDGKLENKKNTFTDYIDVTEHLVAEKYAHPSKVFGMGGSAGGLLMGAVANLAPEHYRGLVAHVPFVDVVTTMLDESIPLTTNEFDEWGNPKTQTYYDYMLSYSPYDQVSKQAYPAMLVTTGLHDSQVQYFEPAKWVAKLRYLKTDDNPLMFKTNMEAGHGGSSGRFSRLKETAEEYAFILNLLGAKAPQH